MEASRLNKDQRRSQGWFEELRWFAQPPFWPTEDFIHCLAIHFKYPAVCEWFTSLVAIENHHCPNEFRHRVCSWRTSRWMLNAQVSVMPMQWKDTCKHFRHSIVHQFSFSESPLTIKLDALPSDIFSCILFHHLSPCSTFSCRNWMLAGLISKCIYGHPKIGYNTLWAM